MNVDGTNRHVISSPMCFSVEPPHFSPDGNLILYVGVFPEDTCPFFREWAIQIVDTLGGVAGGFIQQGTVMGALFGAPMGNTLPMRPRSCQTGVTCTRALPHLVPRFSGHRVGIVN